MRKGRLYPYRRWLLPLVAAALLLAALSQIKVTWKPQASGEPAVTAAAAGGAKPADTLPDEAGMTAAAENDRLKLLFDRETGHFAVRDKRTGQAWRSYPNPAGWAEESAGGLWRTHLQSPLMLQYKDFSRFNTQPKETNTLAEGGKVERITALPGGVGFVFGLPSLGMEVEVRITLGEDYVQTQIVDAGLAERSGLKLLWLRLYPFFGAERSDGSGGFIFIPDGSGALIEFDRQGNGANRIYQESVYGTDMSFAREPGTRLPALMPVFGMNARNTGFLAVLTEGEAHAQIAAAPAGAFGGYNWAAAQQTYRSSYYQTVSEVRKQGYLAYNTDNRFTGDRTARYYLLDGEAAGYVGMAARYRQHLMEEHGLAPASDSADEALPLYVTLIGGDRERGMLSDRYLRATTTEEAAGIVDKLRESGVKRMVVTYDGWQKGGYSAFGGYLPVDGRLGGNRGMREFVDYAHSLDVPVYLGVRYDVNNTGLHGFNPRYHAVRNLAGEIQGEYSFFGDDKAPLVSAKFAAEALRRDLPAYEALGVDGLVLHGAGSRLASDFNSGYGVGRPEAGRLERDMLADAKAALGGAAAGGSSFYVLSGADRLLRLPDDYSYDLFSQKAVPFAQIVLHGLVAYTSGDGNDRERPTHDLLKDIEYGAAPAYTFTHADSDTLRYAYGARSNSTGFADWSGIAAAEYARYNEALGAVRNQFIVGHRELAEGVMETEYSGGRRIVVNYNKQPYRYGSIQVAPENFAVAEGGGQDG